MWGLDGKRIKWIELGGNLRNYIGIWIGDWWVVGVEFWILD